jgi:hypothetical protein
MIEMDTFKIILLGIAPDNDRATVCSNLAKAFRTTPEKIGHLISTCPVTIKTNVDHQTALGYVDIIQTAGGQCKIADEHPGDPARDNQQGASAALKTCANCGYAATTADDPLLTAYDGKGECPACGTIAAKLAESQGPVPQPEPVNADPQEDDDTPSALVRTIGSVLSRPWTALFVVLAAVGIVYGFLQDSSTDKKQAKVALTEKTAPATTPSPEPAAQQPDIYPGETREVMVTLYLPYLHRDSYSSMHIKPKTKLSKNTWDKDGVEAEIIDTTIDNETVTLWEYRRKNDSYWVPDAGCRIYSEVGGAGRIDPDKPLLHAEFPAKVALDPEPGMTIVEGDPDQRQNTYTVYRVQVLLTISVPSGPQFEVPDPLPPATLKQQPYERARQTGSLVLDIMAELSVDGNLLKSPSVNGWQANKMTRLRPQTAIIDMVHRIDLEGVFLRSRDMSTASGTYCRLKLR